MKTSDWKFNKEVSENFDQHVRYHIPFYDVIHDMVENLSVWFAQSNSCVYDLGCSRGELLFKIYEKNKHKDGIHYTGIDNSIHMIDIAKDFRAKNYKEESQIFSFVDDEIESCPIAINSASFITSILTLQFIPINERQELLNDLYNSLTPNGAFVLFEKVWADNAISQDIFGQIYHDAKSAGGVKDKEILDKQRSIRGILMPLSLEDNISMLKQAGFKKIDVCFCWCNFVGILAVK